LLRNYNLTRNCPSTEQPSNTSSIKDFLPHKSSPSPNSWEHRASGKNRKKIPRSPPRRLNQSS
jgi:hypothetical protein